MKANRKKIAVQSVAERKNSISKYLYLDGRLSYDERPFLFLFQLLLVNSNKNRILQLLIYQNINRFEHK